MKHSLKNFLVFFWKSFINNNSGFKLYNYLQENKYLPYFLLEIFVRLNRYVVMEAKGKKNAYLNLVGNDKKLLLPDLLTESHWQFFNHIDDMIHFMQNLSEYFFSTRPQVHF